MMGFCDSLRHRRAPRHGPRSTGRWAWHRMAKHCFRDGRSDLSDLSDLSVGIENKATERPGWTSPHRVIGFLTAGGTLICAALCDRTRVTTDIGVCRLLLHFEAVVSVGTLPP